MINKRDFSLEIFGLSLGLVYYWRNTCFMLNSRSSMVCSRHCSCLNPRRFTQSNVREHCSRWKTCFHGCQRAKNDHFGHVHPDWFKCLFEFCFISKNLNFSNKIKNFFIFIWDLISSAFQWQFFTVFSCLWAYLLLMECK